MIMGDGSGGSVGVGNGYVDGDGSDHHGGSGDNFDGSGDSVGVTNGKGYVMMMKVMKMTMVMMLTVLMMMILMMES